MWYGPLRVKHLDNWCCCLICFKLRFHVNFSYSFTFISSIKVNLLFRSVAHYNLPDGAILETTSNPLMVSMINTKIIEVDRERDANPNDPGIQKWTNQSKAKKVTLLSVLFNSSK